MIFHYSWNWANLRGQKSILTFSMHRSGTKRLRVFFVYRICYVILSTINDTRLLCFAGLAYTTEQLFHFADMKKEEIKLSIKKMLCLVFYELTQDVTATMLYCINFFDYRSTIKIDLEAHAVFLHPSFPLPSHKNFLVFQLRWKTFLLSVIT